MEFRQRNEFLLQEDDDYGEEGGDRDEQEQLRLDITMADLTDGELRQVEILDKAAEHLLYAKHHDGDTCRTGIGTKGSFFWVQIASI